MPFAGQTEELGHACVLPGHRRIRRLLYALIIIASVMLSIAACSAGASAWASALSGALSATYFSYLMRRVRRGGYEAGDQALTLPMMIASLLVTSLFEPAAGSAANLRLLPALLDALRHLVLPLLVFMYWVIFCGSAPLRLRKAPRRLMLVACVMGLTLIDTLLSRQSLAPLSASATTGWLPGWQYDVLRVASMMAVFVAVLRALQMGKAGLMNAGRSANAFRI